MAVDEARDFAEVAADEAILARERADRAQDLADEA